MAPRDFDAVIAPHLDAAFNYARWLTKNEADAEDVLQDAALRALRFLPSLRNDDARAWLLTIVRNTWYGRLTKEREVRREMTNEETMLEQLDDRLGPEALAVQQQTVEHVQEAIESLPVEFREVVVLRELEGLAYKDIAAIVGVPIGTVMSRLSRARERLLAVLKPAISTGGGV